MKCPETDNPGTKKSGVILFASSYLLPGDGSVMNVAGIWTCVEKPENGVRINSLNVN